MNKMHHWFLAALSLPFNLIAISCMVISYWIISIGKDKKSYTYTQVIKHVFGLKEEIDKDLSKKMLRLCEEKIAEAKIKWLNEQK